MRFTLFQMIVVLIPTLVGVFACVMVTLATATDETMEPKVRFMAPFTLGVWLVCTLWAFWPVIMR